MRLRRPVMNRPPTSSEAADGALLRFTPRPRSASRSAARFPLAGGSVPVLAIESREHRKRTCTVGGDPRPALRRLASCALPPSGPRRTTSRLVPFTPRSNNPAPSWGILRPHHPATASWSPLPCRKRLPFLCRSHVDSSSILLVYRSRFHSDSHNPSSASCTCRDR